MLTIPPTYFKTMIALLATDALGSHLAPGTLWNLTFFIMQFVLTVHFHQILMYMVGYNVAQSIVFSIVTAVLLTLAKLARVRMYGVLPLMYAPFALADFPLFSGHAPRLGAMIIAHVFGVFTQHHKMQSEFWPRAALFLELVVFWLMLFVEF